MSCSRTGCLSSFSAHAQHESEKDFQISKSESKSEQKYRLTVRLGAICMMSAHTRRTEICSQTATHVAGTWCCSHASAICPAVTFFLAASFFTFSTNLRFCNMQAICLIGCRFHSMSSQQMPAVHAGQASKQQTAYTAWTGCHSCFK